MQRAANTDNKPPARIFRRGGECAGHRRHEFEELVSSILEAVPGLRGYIGIDLVITELGPIVMEINPRLTEAYVGLRQSLRFNPAAPVVDSCMRIPVR